MAVLQISKIQVRRGKENEVGVPALSAGEFAWSIDVQKLYIGNGSVSEGAPQTGYTEVVTFTNDSVNKLFSQIPFYSYGTQITTANKLPTNSSAIRPIFAKLDEYVSTADYGTTGDNTDNTLALQDAIVKTFLNSDNTNPSSRKTLRIPAGTYVVTGTVYIPPYTTLVGEGIDKTIIKLNLPNGGVPVFQFCGIDPTASGSGLSRTATYPNIQGSINPPTNITIEGMTLTYANLNSQGGQGGLLEADTAIDSKIKNVKFLGVRTTNISTEYLACIEIRGLDSTAPNNLTIEDCVFENMFAGIQSRFNCSNITIQNNKFYNLGYGVLFNDNQGNAGAFPPGRIGPQYVNVSNNHFELTYNEAISVDDPNDELISSYISSSNNKYINCGNGTGLQLDKVQRRGVISFATQGNKSVNDYFSRFEKNNDTIDAPATLLPCISGVAYVQNTSPIGFSAIQSPIGQPMLTLAKITDIDQTVTVDYVAQQAGITRRGVVKVVTDDIVPIITEEYSYNGTNDGGFYFSASLTTATNALTISITSPQAATDVIYQFNQLY